MFMALERMHWSEIIPTLGRLHLGEIVDVTIGMAACEACSAAWNFGYQVKPRKTLFQLVGYRTFRMLALNT
jgi:hypothetical protein